MRADNCKHFGLQSDNEILCPDSMKKGATIGIFSPSDSAAALYPRRFQRGILQLQRIGYKVKLAKHVSCNLNGVAGTAKQRAEDFMSLITDPDILAIIATIGGTHTIEILPYIDWKAVSDNRKWVVGYSDTTILSCAMLSQAGCASLYGPTLMTEFSDYPYMWPESEQSFVSALQSNFMPIVPFSEIAGNRIDWGSKDDSRCSRKRVSAPKPIPLVTGIAEGIVVGGCLESLESILGTPWWQPISKSILILETSSDEPNIEKIDSFCKKLSKHRMWEQLSGVVFGTKNWDDELMHAVAEVLLCYTRTLRIPTAIGLPFGHITPIATIPIGVTAMLTVEGDTEKSTDATIKLKVNIKKSYQHSRKNLK